MKAEQPLVAVVEKQDVDTVIAAVKESGTYDSNRHIREADASTLEIPITSRNAPVDRVTLQDNPPWRVRDLEDYLRVRGASDAVIEAAPASWAVIGDLILVTRPSEYGTEIGEALLELHNNATTVLATDQIVGEHRQPTVRVIAGKPQTRTVHREHGTAYELDLSEVMFSPGNVRERTRMGDRVSPEETVFDMFAGIGYFTLPMARAGATVIATERNPASFRYLQRNLARNGVRSVVSAYRMDCRALRPRVDRVVMGHFDAYRYLDTAIAAVRPGGTIHLHGLGVTDSPWQELREQLVRAAGERPVQITDKRVVKSHSPGLDHIVLDATIG